MAKKKSKKRADAPDVFEEKRQKRSEAFKKNKKYILPLCLNTVVFCGAYMYLVTLPCYMAVLWVYFALTAGFLLAYVIYNRGFSRNKVTPEMLPDSMSYAEKEEFIADGRRRIEKSKWMLTIIFPLVFTFVVDALIMFVFEPLAVMIGESGISSF